MSNLRMRGAVPPFPICLYGDVLNKAQEEFQLLALYFFLTLYTDL
jgi:hypothetical protein